MYFQYAFDRHFPTCCRGNARYGTEIILYSDRIVTTAVVSHVGCNDTCAITCTLVTCTGGKDYAKSNSQRFSTENTNIGSTLVSAFGILYLLQM